jgi:hypothetical protein
MYNISNLSTSYQLTWNFSAVTNYGDNEYNTSTYGETAEATDTVSNGGALANTGIAILGITTLACLIVLVAVIVRVWRRPHKPKADTN